MYFYASIRFQLIEPTNCSRNSSSGSSGNNDNGKSSSNS